MGTKPLMGASFAGVATPCPLPQTPVAHARIVHTTVVNFCSSKDPELSLNHVYIPPPKDGNSSSQKIPPPSKEWVLRSAREVWGMMHPSSQPWNGRNVAGGGGGRRGEFTFPKTFDGIMKEYQLTKPNLSEKYDLILLDEAQDVNDCQADIIARQSGCRVIVVGDPHQAIYGWRGAKDYLARVKNAKTLRLTQVFRFGTGVACVANTLLRRLKGERVPLLGSLASSSCGPAKVLFEDERDEWLKQPCEDRGRYAFIARTNAALRFEAIVAIRRGDRVAIQNGPGTLKLPDVRDMCYMMNGNLSKVQNKELKEIGSIAELRKLIDDVDDTDTREFASTLSTVDHFVEEGQTPMEILEEMEGLKSKLQPHTDMGGPLVILSTVHKLKGLEFDTVVLADDFSFEPLDGRPLSFKSKGENTNLIYVAVTRAKRQLFLNHTLARQLRAYRLWDSVALPGLASDLTHDSRTPIPCHGYACTAPDPWGLAPVNTDGAAPGGGGGDEEGGAGVSQTPRLLFAGSGSTGPLCQTCVEGAADVGSFPYAAQFFKARRKA